MTLSFDGKTDKLVVHTAPNESGGHEHYHGSYTLDAASGAVTLRCALLGKGKGEVWKGRLEASHLTLAHKSTTLKFSKSKAKQDH